MLKSDLSGFAEITREIGCIAYIAGDIELTSINGMLVANKSAGASTGFGIAAQEIHALSSYFIQVTQELGLLVNQMAYLVGNGMVLARRVRTLNATAACGERVQQFIFNACKNCCKEFNANATRIRNLANEVLHLLQRAEMQCLMGIALGCSGKIEAIYGGAMEGRLLQVSIELQDRIAELLERLKTLNTGIQVWQA